MMKTLQQKIVKKAFMFINEVTICLIRNESGDVYRGVSVCSSEDHYNRQWGKMEAERYAMRAMKGRECPAICTIEAINTIAMLRVKKWKIWQHGEENPVLSDAEIKLIKTNDDGDGFRYEPHCGVAPVDLPL